jgi:hypothetical protein
MITTHPEVLTSRHFQGLILPAHPTSGTQDDDDDRDDEHASENETPVRAVDEDTETPEEFEIDEEVMGSSRALAPSRASLADRPSFARFRP